MTTTSVWGQKSKMLPPFENAVRWLSPEAKKAMYAAAAGRLIKRGTWNGCAFNAGGIEVGETVQSYEAAAMAFKMPLKSVVNFIRCWDNLDGSDNICTQRLREAIEAVGIFSPRGTIRVINIKIFSGQKQQEEMETELQEMIANGKANEVEFATEAAELLSMCNA